MSAADAGGIGRSLVLNAPPAGRTSKPLTAGPRVAVAGSIGWSTEMPFVSGETLVLVFVATDGDGVGDSGGGGGGRLFALASAAAAARSLICSATDSGRDRSSAPVSRVTGGVWSVVLSPLVPVSAVPRAVSASAPSAGGVDGLNPPPTRRARGTYSSELLYGDGGGETLEDGCDGTLDAAIIITSSSSSSDSRWRSSSDSGIAVPENAVFDEEAAEAMEPDVEALAVGRSPPELSARSFFRAAFQSTGWRFSDEPIRDRD